MFNKRYGSSPRGRSSGSDNRSSDRTESRSSATGYRSGYSNNSGSSSRSSYESSHSDRPSSGGYATSGNRSFGHSSSAGSSYRSGTYHSSRNGGGSAYGRRFAPRLRAPNRIPVEKFINKVQQVDETVNVITHDFTDFNLNERLLQNVLAKGYTKPLPIQDQAIPHLLVGRDLVGLANTGMGKTAAFLIPLIQKIINDPSQRVIIITPTRELAEQIDGEFRLLARGLNQYSVLAIGGMGIQNQIRDLSRYYSFLIGTPGRLKDLQGRRKVNYAQFNNIVLDEVDRMFDMGFSKEIIEIINQLPKNRQSLFFSATITNQVEKTINQNSNNPVTIQVKTRDTAATVDQDIIRVTESGQKMEVLQKLLYQEEVKKVLIFGRTKHGVKRLAIELADRGFKADSIHGNKTQQQRKRVLDSFRQDRLTILVATDVAARGLDIPNVSHVINFDIPETYEDYIHRIGRTGRANKVGKALTFV